MLIPTCVAGAICFFVFVSPSETPKPAELSALTGYLEAHSAPLALLRSDPCG